MSDHYYVFKMYDNDAVVEMKIPGDATALQLLEQVRYFMMSVGYDADTVKELTKELDND